MNPQCPKVQLTVRPHENADRLERVQARGYECVAGKGTFRTGDEAIYIPEDSILPDNLLAHMNLTGKLAGKAKNRVKAVRLRGALSQGLLYPLENGKLSTPWNPAPIHPHDPETNAIYLGITKYVPDIPQSMNGAQTPNPDSPHYEIENLQSWPDALIPGEAVYCTEKIHGTLCCWMNLKGQYHAASKGMLRRAVFQDTPENRQKNVYVKTLHQHREMLDALTQRLPSSSWWLFGEIYGPKIQDLHYGLEQGNQFRAFDLCIQQGGHRVFCNPQDFIHHCEAAKIPTVPQLKTLIWPDLQGKPIDAREILEEQLGLHRETVSGTGVHVSEGAVLRPAEERHDPRMGRVILKLKHPDYLTRKGGTERS